MVISESVIGKSVISESVVSMSVTVGDSAHHLRCEYRIGFDNFCGLCVFVAVHSPRLVP